VKLVQTRSEDGTAIGDALALAAARLKTIEETLAQHKEGQEGSYKIKSKIIILLSDGENNSGKRDPIQAAELAEKWKIKVYTIAMGSGDAVTTIRTAFGVYKVPMRQPVDTATLKAVAEKTGGLFREADNAEALRTIYQEIDKLEKSEIQSVRFIDYKESFLFFALAGLILMGCEIILNLTLFRKIP
jgi:Ca-activated chloride channel family protein